MKGRKRKKVNDQIFERAANLGHFLQCGLNFFYEIGQNLRFEPQHAAKLF